MCGIVGVIGVGPAAPMMLDALRRLEYRGYDSAGIATLVNGAIERRRAAGKLGNLADALRATPLHGTTGIGHTRWATHGAPTESNAHPHATARVAVCTTASSRTTPNCAPSWSARGRSSSPRPTPRRWCSWSICSCKRGMEPLEAAGKAFPGCTAPTRWRWCCRASGAAGWRRAAWRAAGGGVRRGRDVLGSDALALAPLTRRIAYLKDGDWVAVDRNAARFFDATGAEVQREIRQTAHSGATVGKGNFRHFMEKELLRAPGGAR